MNIGDYIVTPSGRVGELFRVDADSASVRICSTADNESLDIETIDTTTQNVSALCRMATDEEKYKGMALSFVHLCKTTSIEDLLHEFEFCDLPFMMEKLWSGYFASLKMDHALTDIVRVYKEVDPYHVDIDLCITYLMNLRQFYSSDDKGYRDENVTYTHTATKKGMCINMHAIRPKKLSMKDGVWQLYVEYTLTKCDITNNRYRPSTVTYHYLTLEPGTDKIVWPKEWKDLTAVKWGCELPLRCATKYVKVVDGTHYAFKVKMQGDWYTFASPNEISIKGFRKQLLKMRYLPKKMEFYPLGFNVVEMPDDMGGTVSVAVSKE